jgi:hypothetical protein
MAQRASSLVVAGGPEEPEASVGLGKEPGPPGKVSRGFKIYVLMVVVVMNIVNQVRPEPFHAP